MTFLASHKVLPSGLTPQSRREYIGTAIYSKARESVGRSYIPVMRYRPPCTCTTLIMVLPEYRYCSTWTVLVRYKYTVCKLSSLLGWLIIIDFTKAFGAEISPSHFSLFFCMNTSVNLISGRDKRDRHFWQCYLYYIKIRDCDLKFHDSRQTTLGNLP